MNKKPTIRGLSSLGDLSSHDSGIMGDFEVKVENAGPTDQRCKDRKDQRVLLEDWVEKGVAFSKDQKTR